MAEATPKFDPIGILAALERERVNFIAIGAPARVIQGTGERARAASTSCRRRGQRTSAGSGTLYTN
ncbi:MAG: hypothetical protein H0V20_03450 [Actinobacteria bacterium]|nr:hypothetical protein [Actinomycetota bacterium]